MRTQPTEYSGLAVTTRRESWSRPYISQPPRELPLLTTKQAEIVALLRRGIHSRKEIAFFMGNTVGGMSTVFDRLYRRLQKHGYAVDNLTALAIFAFQPEVLKRPMGL
jgi:DNA-binding NarL/FixJ family response regulator